MYYQTNALQSTCEGARQAGIVCVQEGERTHRQDNPCATDRSNCRFLRKLGARQWQQSELGAPQALGDDVHPLIVSRDLEEQWLRDPDDSHLFQRVDVSRTTRNTHCEC